jgi:hypothetical protein
MTNKTKIMKRIVYLRLLVSIAAILVATGSFAQRDTITPIEAIDVDLHLDMYTTVEGLVTQYTAASEGATAYYILKGEYGRPIQVNTSFKKPIINRKYRVKGIVKANPLTDQPYLVEIKKTMIIPIWIFLALGGIILLIVGVLLVFLLGDRMKGGQPAAAADTGADDQPSPGKTEYDEEFKTVKIMKEREKYTLFNIPGKLRILHGEDAGKEIRLMGRLISPRGGFVTLGSIEKSEEEAAYHVRIMDRTVSRQQAEITHHAAENKTLIKNLSKVNYTRVNDAELNVDETREIKHGDRIKCGAAEFEFVSA